jgi:hypothetical protein
MVFHLTIWPCFFLTKQLLRKYINIGEGSRGIARKRKELITHSSGKGCGDQKINESMKLRI